MTWGFVGLRHSEISEVDRPSRRSRPPGCDVKQVGEVLPGTTWW
jgi:hypothetical protein